MSTNHNLSPSIIKHGSLSLQESMNDYPRLTITEYTEPGVSRKIGEVRSHAGLVFVLEGISIEKCPVPVNGLQDKLTYNYVHVSSKILDYPIRVKNFTDLSTPVKRTAEQNFYSIGSLVNYAASQGRLGTVIPPTFLVALSRNPSAEEEITLKSLIDERLEVLRLVYGFSGSSAFFCALGSRGSIAPVLIKNYTIGYGLTSAYKDSILSWDKKNEQAPQTLDTKRYKKLDDNAHVLYEGDYNPHIPPAESNDNTKYPRDLSIMFDNSGTTRTCKLTKYKWDKPEVELEATWGFAHAAIELVDDPNKPNVQSDRVIALMSESVVESGNSYQEILSSIKSGKYGYPDDANFSNGIVWRLISVKQKEYIYQPLGVTVTPRIKNKDGTYSQAQVAAGLDKANISNTQVLVRELTQGWELKRFAQEDAQNWTKGSIEGWLQLKALVALGPTLQSSSIIAKQQYYWMLYYSKLNVEKFLYRKIPLWEQVDYAVEAYSKYYTDAEKVEWQVQKVPANQIAGYAADDTRELNVVYPDPNWEPALVLLAQSRLKLSIGLSGNPDYDPYKRNYFATNPISITTGSEEYELTVHTILPSKNTKRNVSLIPMDIPSVLAAVDSQLDIKGTFYQDKEFVQIPDYGLKDYPLPSVDLDRMKAPIIGAIDKVNDRYTTTTSLRVAQDHSYKNHLTTTNFTLADGRPPSATTRKPTFEEIQNDSDSNPFTNTATYITSSNYTPYTNLISSVSISSAENLQEAINAASFKLTMEALGASSSSISLHYYGGNTESMLNRSTMIPGTNNTWVIKGVTQSIHYTDGKGFPQPVELECGILISPAIDSRSVQIKDTSNNNQDSAEIELVAELPRRYGTPIESIPDNFGRWLDTN